MTANVIERPTETTGTDGATADPSGAAAEAAGTSAGTRADEDGTHRAGPAPTAETVPDDVVDRLLWRDAQYILARHHECDDTCAYCGAAWPCTATRLARRAEAAARLPWREGWTTRHDLNAVLALPGWRAARPPAQRPAVRRPFAR
ncbi:hypothetical protein [Actinocatenispora rupis]|uniref:Uncharacterized protein n=1 Tax=Actinocatenispora rupis TaxID=519421 RepID=A0A8J3NDN3_9ACTN|nr:hypothetical protein [Actinocatenispora rupis]GID13115.1 hypothetical protein Aru02nite_40040 [Actinocatenispora rupis]